MGDFAEQHAATPDDLLALRFGGRTVAENLDAAIAAGELVVQADGKLAPPPSPRAKTNWVQVLNRPMLPCGFLTHMMFYAAYAGTAVPHGCSACYKIKVRLTSLRQLMAAWQLAKSLDCLSKWGLDIDNRYSQDIYAGYFYPGDLDEARVLYRVARDAIDADARLGPEVAMTIKRGCSRFEAAVGPSDQYRFTPEMAALEAHLRARFAAPRIADPSILPLVNWIETAFRIGDETYRDFTNGERLRPATISYDP